MVGLEEVEVGVEPPENLGDGVAAGLSLRQSSL